MSVFSIPTILRSDELLDKAFKKASKVSISGKGIGRKKKLARGKIESLSQTIDSTLRKYVKSFPTIDSLHPFYKALIDILLDTDRLKKSLASLDWCRRTCIEVARENSRKIFKTKNPQQIDSIRKAVYGRVSSIVDDISKELLYLNEARQEIRKMPTIDPDIPTIVVSGYPNVGKSQLVRAMSSAKPRIASYPFTTQRVSIGHFERDRTSYQVIDTPGLLDRELEDRNAIERQAINALEHLADLVIFVLDPTETCGYDIGKQENLLNTIKKEFTEIPVIQVENKMDISKTSSENRKISALTGIGVEELVENAVETITSLSPEASGPLEYH
ncbi:MAG: 50S ribosome-binding GTPase [Methanobacteriota archaeon]|nr:MAG: 50S ribosome-binding GTPase [Euryarchaeota archaeon]